MDYETVRREQFDSMDILSGLSRLMKESLKSGGLFENTDKAEQIAYSMLNGGTALLIPGKDDR